MRQSIGFSICLAAAGLLAACAAGEGSDAPATQAEDGEEAATMTPVDAALADEALPGEEAGGSGIAEIPPVPAGGERWMCEGEGDAAIWFEQLADGMARVGSVAQSEMAPDDTPSYIAVEATGASAGAEDRYGRMRSEDGNTTVWFLRDGNVEITDGVGEDALTFVCEPA